VRVLIVGAGAVGQVYGHRLSLGGAEVSFLVKPAHVGEAEHGYPLHELRTWRKPKSTRFVPHSVISDLAQAAEEPWDQLWLCVSSTALRKPGFEDILTQARADVLVALQPGLEDRHWLEERWLSDRLVRGVIPLIAYQSPLPGRDDQPAGIAWWLPPATKVPFDGPTDAVARVTRVLRAGGWPARHVPGSPEGAASISAVLMPHLAALEDAGWSFDALKTGDRLRVATAASKQALAVVSHDLGRPIPGLAARVSRAGCACSWRSPRSWSRCRWSPISLGTSPRWATRHACSWGATSLAARALACRPTPWSPCWPSSRARPLVAGYFAR
jgi:hypothetical protein